MSMREKRERKRESCVNARKVDARGELITVRTILGRK